MSSDEDFEDDDVVNLMDSGERGELDLQGRIARTLSTAAAAAAADDDDDGSSSSGGEQTQTNSRAITADYRGRDTDDTDDDRGSPSPVPDPSLLRVSSTTSTTTTLSTAGAETTNTNTNTNTAVIPSAPVSVDLSQNFELSLSTNEQLYHLLKDSHMANERLTARVHELERANKALVAAQKAGLASTLGGVGGSDGGGSMATPGSYGAAGASPGGGGVGGSSGVTLSTLVAERDAALSEMEVLQARARDAEKNADNMVDAMRQAVRNFF